MSVRLRATLTLAPIVGLTTFMPVSIRRASEPAIVIRVNQLGYLPNAPKTAVACVDDDSTQGAPTAAPLTYVVQDTSGRIVQAPRTVRPDAPFGPCVVTYRLDFSSVRAPGRYRIVSGTIQSPVVRVDARTYAGAADTLLYYMRQQRSGYNPTLRDSVHKRDGIIVDHPTRSGEFIPVTGGWADAADYLQYVTTTATATYVMLKARLDFPRAFADGFDANGLPGPNGTDDALDEARHGLEWLLRMFPDDSTMFNQLADDRDHTYFDLPTSDSADYGWGKGKERPVLPREQPLWFARARVNPRGCSRGRTGRTGTRPRPANTPRRSRSHPGRTLAGTRRSQRVCATARSRRTR